MKRQNSLLVAMAATSVVAGLIKPHMSHPERVVDELWVVETFVMAILLFVWCKAHAESRSIQPPAGAPLLVGLVAVIGVPYYFFRTMPWRSALWACSKALGFLLALMFLSIVAAVVSGLAVT